MQPSLDPSPQTDIPPPAPVATPDELARQRRAALAAKRGRQALVIDTGTDPGVYTPGAGAALTIPRTA